MKILSLKLDDAIFKDIEKIIAALPKTMNQYINEAIAQYNKLQKRKIIEDKLAKESLAVRDESMSVLKEFEDFHIF